MGIIVLLMEISEYDSPVNPYIDPYFLHRPVSSPHHDKPCEYIPAQSYLGFSEGSSTDNILAVSD
jgi:hypothetical protein